MPGSGMKAVGRIVTAITTTQVNNSPIILYRKNTKIRQNLKNMATSQFIMFSKVIQKLSRLLII